MGGGFRCAIIDCPNSTEKTKKISFFRFPKDPNRFVYEFFIVI